MNQSVQYWNTTLSQRAKLLSRSFLDTTVQQAENELDERAVYYGVTALQQMKAMVQTVSNRSLIEYARHASIIENCRSARDDKELQSKAAKLEEQFHILASALLHVDASTARLLALLPEHVPVKTVTAPAPTTTNDYSWEEFLRIEKVLKESNWTVEQYGEYCEQQIRERAQEALEVQLKQCQEKVGLLRDFIARRKQAEANPVSLLKSQAA